MSLIITVFLDSFPLLLPLCVLFFCLLCVGVVFGLCSAYCSCQNNLPKKKKEFLSCVNVAKKDINRRT